MQMPSTFGARAAPPAKTTIALSLTEDYAPQWGVWEGVRELVQNWHDGCLRGNGRVEWVRNDANDHVARIGISKLHVDAQPAFSQAHMLTHSRVMACIVHL